MTEMRGGTGDKHNHDTAQQGKVHRLLFAQDNGAPVWFSHQDYGIPDGWQFADDASVDLDSAGSLNYASTGQPASEIQVQKTVFAALVRQAINRILIPFQGYRNIPHS